MDCSRGRTSTHTILQVQSNGKVTRHSESFKIFQGKILDEYDHMVSEFGLTVIDGTQPIRVQQRQMRDIVSRHLKEKLKEVVPSK